MSLWDGCWEAFWAPCPWSLRDHQRRTGFQKLKDTTEVLPAPCRPGLGLALCFWDNFPGTGWVSAQLPNPHLGLPG